MINSIILQIDKLVSIHQFLWEFLLLAKHVKHLLIYKPSLIKTSILHNLPLISNLYSMNPTHRLTLCHV